MAISGQFGLNSGRSRPSANEFKTCYVSHVGKAWRIIDIVMEPLGPIPFQNAAKPIPHSKSPQCSHMVYLKSRCPEHRSAAPFSHKLPPIGLPDCFWILFLVAPISWARVLAHGCLHDASMCHLRMRVQTCMWYTPLCVLLRLQACAPGQE